MGNTLSNLGVKGNLDLAQSRFRTSMALCIIGFSENDDRAMR